MKRPPAPTTLAEIYPVSDNYLLFYAILEQERQTAVRDLARLLVTLNCLTAGEALREIERLKQQEGQ